jgi:hypothetical protein
MKKIHFIAPTRGELPSLPDFSPRTFSRSDEMAIQCE